MQLSLSQRRAIRHGLELAGLLAAGYMYLVIGDPTWRRIGADALVYWGVDPGSPYQGSTVGGLNAYLYSPAFAQVFALIGLIPQPLFVLVWTALLAGVAWWLARPWPGSLLVLALPVSQEILIGQIHLLLAAAIVVGFRWSGTWAFVLLTKVTPGVGLFWFVVRREWSRLALAMAVTGAIFLASFLANPQAWFDWVQLLRGDGATQARGSLLIRLLLATVIVAWGARTQRPWTVPLSAMVALPVIWMDSFSMLLGCVALWPQSASSRREASTSQDQPGTDPAPTAA